MRLALLMCVCGVAHAAAKPSNSFGLICVGVIALALCCVYVYYVRKRAADVPPDVRPEAQPLLPRLSAIRNSPVKPAVAQFIRVNLNADCFFTGAGACPDASRSQTRESPLSTSTSCNSEAPCA